MPRRLLSIRVPQGVPSFPSRSSTFSVEGAPEVVKATSALSGLKLTNLKLIHKNRLLPKYTKIHKIFKISVDLILYLIYS
jgi:hypothetical protein